MQAAAPKNGTRLNRFVFTLNNYDQMEYEEMKKFVCLWMVIGKERGAEGTPHLQGACVIGKQMAFSSLKTTPGFRRCHIEPMFGTPEQSLAYCTKEDSNAFVKGTLPSQGKRNDILMAVEALDAGLTMRELCQSHGVVVVKMYKGLIQYRSYISKPRDPASPPCIFWLHGPTGVGKTRCLFEFGRRCTGSDDDIYISNGSLQWFNGYDGQKCAILDEFRSTSIKEHGFAWFLRLLDRYPFQVPFKGGFVNWNPSYIFLSSPYSPEECFSSRKEHLPEDLQQLNRRINGDRAWGDYRVVSLGSQHGTDDERARFLDELDRRRAI
nr:MAG TPA: Rep protein [Cressdnaviricota sp.]